MKLTDICVSLELAKELKENGFKQDCLFSWVVDVGKGKDPYVVYTETLKAAFEISPKYGLREFKWIAAPTASELGEVLPNFVYMCLSGGGRHGERVGYVVGENFHARLLDEKYPKERDNMNSFNDKNLANAMAKMWLYLNKEGLL